MVGLGAGELIVIYVRVMDGARRGQGRGALECAEADITLVVHGQTRRVADAQSLALLRVNVCHVRNVTACIKPAKSRVHHHRVLQVLGGTGWKRKYIRRLK